MAAAQASPFDQQSTVADSRAGFLYSVALEHVPTNRRESRSSTMSPQRSAMVFGSAILLWAMLSGCMGDRCSEGQVLKGGACMPPTPDGGLKDQARLESGSVEREARTADGEDLSSLGRDCTDASGCHGKADFCVILPGQPKGYCSIDGCALAPNDCPKGYRCIDVSAYTTTPSTLCYKE
jgi:hypothetical protein